MIRLKQSTGNVIKCKIDAEDMISKYECSVLEDNRLNGLLSIQVDKNSAIVYSDDVKKNLADVLNGSLDEERVNDYLCQIARVILDVKKMGLNPEKLVLNPEWVYLTKDEKILKFIYCPVNGMCGRYDGILFMKDVLLQVPLSKDLRDRWKQWLETVTGSGITEQAVVKMEKMGKGSKDISEAKKGSYSDYDENGEAKTTVEKVAKDVWENDYTDEENDLESWASTFYEGQSYGFTQGESGRTTLIEQECNDDGEAPTGMGESCGDGSKMVEECSNNKPSLVRVNTGEKVAINHDNFKLGRSEQRADFCIRNNSGISNVHATIIIKNEQYFLKDNYSTNGTYVDGNKISDSSTPVLLRDGSVIQLYNEEIVFNY